MLNTIINSDCLNTLPLIESKSIDLVLTDIPYDEINRESNGLRNLDKGNADVLTFDLEKFLVEIDRVCCGSIYVFCGTLQISTILRRLKEFGLSTRSCVWQKTNPSPMNGTRLWLSGIEHCAYAKNKNATFNEHCKSGVWQFPCGRNKFSRTEKPIKLFKYLIETSSKPGDLVLDPCIGGGTTAVACIESNRNYIGIEYDKQQYEITKARIENLLKNKIN